MIYQTSVTARYRYALEASIAVPLEFQRNRTGAMYVVTAKTLK